MDAKALETFFSENGFILDGKLVGECVSICNIYSKSSEDLLWKIQSINSSSSGPRSEFRPVTMDTLVEAKKSFQQDLAANKMKIKPRATKTTAMTSMAAVDRSKLPSQFAPRGSTTVKPEPFAQSSLSTVISGFVTMNVAFTEHPNDPASKKKRRYRYMYEKISERSEILDQIIDDFADLIRNHYDLKADLGDPSSSTDEEVVIVGRITHDQETVGTSKLVEGAIFIESSRMLSGGARVPLKFSPTMRIKGGVKGSGGFGLFPGKIAAFKGKNGGGGYFLATEYLSIPPLKPSSTALGIINPKLDPAIAQNPATMFVACGPYTDDSDLVYKPWRHLFNEIKAKKPDVILLLGPFVDSFHPKVNIGDMNVSTSKLFEVYFIERLKSYLENSPGSIVLLVPSVRDLVSDHAAYPQPEMSISVHPRIYNLANPTRFKINDISFATTSVDTLFHLRKEEYFKRALDIEPLDSAPDDLPNDAMAGLVRHLLLQRSFYPIFPTPQDLAAEVNLDVSHSDGVQMIDNNDDDDDEDDDRDDNQRTRTTSCWDYAPDVLILPSRLKQFAKVVHSTNTVNPSFVNKGTYASIEIAPPQPPRSTGIVVVTPKQRIKVEIRKFEVPNVVVGTPTVNTV